MEGGLEEREREREIVREGNRKEGRGGKWRTSERCHYAT